MKSLFSAILGSLVLCTALAQTTKEACFREATNLYGSDNDVRKSDLDLIETLSKDHVLTKIEACSIQNGPVSSVQVTYGLWKKGKVKEEVSLTPFGVNSGSCNTLKVTEGDSIKSVEISYSSSGVNKLSFITQLGDFKVTGTSGVSDLVKTFRLDSERSFYGLIGTGTTRIDSISIVIFD